MCRSRGPVTGPACTTRACRATTSSPPNRSSPPACWAGRWTPAHPAAWATADEAYGHDSKFRRFLAQRGIGYVVAIPRSQPIHTGSGTLRADTLVARAPQQSWKRLSAGEGSKGQRLYDWAMAALPGHDHRLAASRWLLARR